MFRNLSISAVVAVVVLIPAQLIAGGPPRLCLPIDGVSADNAQACAKRLTNALGDKLWTHSGRASGIEIHHDKNQSYVTCYLAKPVALSEIEAALKGGNFVIPRDRLRLFGHVILEIDAPKTSPDNLLTDLAAVDYVSVDEWKRDEGILLATVDMPYPVNMPETKWKSFADAIFRSNDLSSDPATKSDPPANSRSLPSYDGFRAILAKHNARLKDLRWSHAWACRTFGGVAVPNTDSVSRQADLGAR